MQTMSDKNYNDLMNACEVAIQYLGKIVAEELFQNLTPSPKMQMERIIKIQDAARAVIWSPDDEIYKDFGCPVCNTHGLKEIKSGLGCYVYCPVCGLETPHVGYIELARKIWIDKVWGEQLKNTCGVCGGAGVVDSGGQDQNGHFFSRECPVCNGKTANNAYRVFYNHIKQELPEGHEVLCKICNRTFESITGISEEHLSCE